MAEQEPTGSRYLHSADWYDTIYAAQGKRYAAEAAVVDGIIRSFAPGAASLLDVGCGTGLHLEEFSRRYDDVAGIDLHPEFVARARERGLAVTVGDMRSFDLERRFDAVVCLYSGIGHVGGPAELDAAIAAMARHLAPRGVLVVEPWVLPEDWRAGEYGVEVADAPDSTLTRVNHTEREGEVAVIRFAWTLVDASGIQRLDEELRLTLFTPAEYRRAFERAGLATSFDPQGCNDDGRGLWIGVRAAIPRGGAARRQPPRPRSASPPS